MGIKNFFGNLFKKNVEEEIEDIKENQEDISSVPNEDENTQYISDEKDSDDNSEKVNDEENKIDLEQEQSQTLQEDITLEQSEIIKDFTEIKETKIAVEKENEQEEKEEIIEVDIEKKEDTIEEIQTKISENEKKIEEIEIKDNSSSEKIIEKTTDELQEDIIIVDEENDKQDEVKEKKGLFARLKEGLKKTSSSLTQKIDNMFKGYLKIDDDLYEELEEILITSDISYTTTLKIVDLLRENIKKKNITDVGLVKSELKEVLYGILSENKSDIDVQEGQSVVVMVGVNGVGKTTTIGKLSSKLQKQGKTVLLAAGDTFRAAAEEQLEIWAQRSNVEIVRHQESGADPSAVIYDAIQKAKTKNIDVLICDTAGRLHNKVNLMNELSKIMRTINKEHPSAKKEVLLVIDATTGQNALNQVKTFNEAVQLTGVILTKLDGTAKGGVILSIIDEFKIPVRFIGVGEKVEDLQVFDSKSFVDALFD